MISTFRNLITLAAGTVMLSTSASVRADHLTSAVFISTTDKSRSNEVSNENGTNYDSKMCNKDFDSALFVTVALLTQGGTTNIRLCGTVCG